MSCGVMCHGEARQGVSCRVVSCVMVSRDRACHVVWCNVSW